MLLQKVAKLQSFFGKVGRQYGGCRDYGLQLIDVRLVAKFSHDGCDTSVSVTEWDFHNGSGDNSLRKIGGDVVVIYSVEMIR